MGLDAVIFVFWMLSFKPAFSPFYFTLIKRLFSSSSVSAIRVVSSAYQGLLILLLEILIPACDSFSLLLFSSMCCAMLSHVRLFPTPWVVACQAPLSMGDSPGRNTGVGCHVLLQGIFLTQESNPYLLCLLHWRHFLYPLRHLGGPS